MEEHETRAFAELFVMDIARLYTAGLIDKETLFDFGEDKLLLRMVETCGASESMPRTTLQLARNLFYKWSEIVAEVAIYNELQHGEKAVKLQAPYLR